MNGPSLVSGVENNSHYLLTSQTEQNLRYCTTGLAAHHEGGRAGGGERELSFMNLKIYCLISATSQPSGGSAWLSPSHNTLSFSSQSASRPNVYKVNQLDFCSLQICKFDDPARTLWCNLVRGLGWQTDRLTDWQTSPARR